MTAQSFDTLRSGSRARLDMLRSQVPAMWQDRQAARHLIRNFIGAAEYPQACPGFNGSAPVLSTFDKHYLPIRSGSVVNHKGWFADAEDTGDQGVIRGFIAAISHGRFLAGYHWSDNDEWVLYCDTAYTDAAIAAHTADEHARVYAEQCRESDARFQAMVRAEEFVEDHTRDAQDAIAARNTTVRNRQWARDAVENLRQSRKELEAATLAYERGAK